MRATHLFTCLTAIAIAAAAPSPSSRTRSPLLYPQTKFKLEPLRAYIADPDACREELAEKACVSKRDAKLAYVILLNTGGLSTWISACEYAPQLSEELRRKLKAFESCCLRIRDRALAPGGERAVVRREEVPQRADGGVRRGNGTARRRVRVPLPLPVADEAREGRDPEEGRDP